MLFANESHNRNRPGDRPDPGVDVRGDKAKNKSDDGGGIISEERGMGYGVNTPWVSNVEAGCGTFVLNAKAQRGGVATKARWHSSVAVGKSQSLTPRCAFAFKKMGRRIRYLALIRQSSSDRRISTRP